MTRHALLIAYHFPPFQGSSGVQRTLGFARYLGDHGWRVSVLTTSESAYTQLEASNSQSVPDDVDVIRAPALDAARHLAVLGRYPLWLARPDRWQSWIPSGIIRGFLAARSRQMRVIFSTFPIASAHVIGGVLRKSLGLPWVADFRDPMVMSTYPVEAAIRRSWSAIERHVARNASRITVTTPGTAEDYLRKFPQLDAGDVTVIPNGFDEDLFALASGHDVRSIGRRTRIKLLHSGALYPQNRNPEPFLRALASLINRGALRPDDVEVVLRASGYEQRYVEQISRLGLQAVVRVEPTLPYVEALDEMCMADGLLIFQGEDFNRQVPAKVYEYLYAGRPILAMTDRDSDTGRLLQEFGVPGIAPLNDNQAIEAMLAAFLPTILDGTYPVVRRDQVLKLSRRARARELAAVFEQVTAEHGSGR